ncbi:GNAT family N-acetyltransferase [Saccharospirillum sp. MSK14-1]|uniref:arsinothricin resistance N-acetyltransferase ArsN1 family A n=1 Tax=Saccharospirillum sp. MSK14-1 TaxID=1897632 RepID=UPI000D39D5A9|nr:arsinothricin resistance N-acetyltransferase ArsN1 family A [Saccharospirillum sp. MSK14-1]PTY36600.1 GNAT family N-acetyltransferase [Saccharospirillum sp. MSK14-1]
MTDELTIRQALADDVADITDIYNRGIESGLGTFETRLREPAEIAAWLDDAERYPTLVAVQGNSVTGFARLSSYRDRPCYDGIAEFSIYLTPQVQGQGVGRRLLTELLTTARAAGFYKVLSRIFTANEASRGLCRKLGFREVGIYERHGQLNGQWLDVVIVEYLT